MRSKHGVILLVVILLFFSLFCSGAVFGESDYDPQQAAAERIKRQVTLANKMKAERLDRERKKMKQSRKEKKRNHYCSKIADGIRRYKESRARWYSLDKNGERVFLTEAQLHAKKIKLNKIFENNCQ